MKEEGPPAIIPLLLYSGGVLVMPPIANAIGFTLSSPTAATRPGTNRRSIRDPLQPHWLLGVETVAVSTGLLPILPQHHLAWGMGTARQTPEAVEATDVAYHLPRRLSRAGAEGRVLDLPKGIPSTSNRVKCGPTQQAKTLGAFRLHRRFNPYPSADSSRPSHGRYL